MAKDGPCRGCFHNYGLFEVNICCNYLFDMGRCRPCPPGEGCTEYITEEAARQQGRKRRAIGMI